jgi:hypothetical protein
VEGILYDRRGPELSGAAHNEGEGVSDDFRRAPAQARAEGESREVKGTRRT